jgi:hypothetical protein
MENPSVAQVDSQDESVNSEMKMGLAVFDPIIAEVLKEESSYLQWCNIGV